MYSGPLSKALSISRSSSCGQCLGYEGITSHVTGTAQHPVKRWVLSLLRAGGSLTVATLSNHCYDYDYSQYLYHKKHN